MVWLVLYEEENVISSNFVHFVKPKQMELVEPEITATITNQADSFLVALQAEKPALWAWLELRDYEAIYDDNFICLRPGPPEQIRITPIAKLSLDQFERALRIKSIYDTY